MKTSTHKLPLLPMSIVTAHKKLQKVFVALSNQHRVCYRNFYNIDNNGNSVIFCAPPTIWPVAHYVVIVKYIIAGRLLVLIKCNNRRNKALFVCCVVVITRQLTEVCVTELPKKRARRSKRSQYGAVQSKLSKLSTISSTFKPSIEALAKMRGINVIIIIRPTMWWHLEMSHL